MTETRINTTYVMMATTTTPEHSVWLHMDESNQRTISAIRLRNCSHTQRRP